MTDPDDYTDPIIEEIRRYREELSLRFPDIESFCDYLREQERLHPWPAGTVSFEQPREHPGPARQDDEPPSDP